MNICILGGTGNISQSAEKFDAAIDMICFECAGVSRFVRTASNTITCLSMRLVLCTRTPSRTE